MIFHHGRVYTLTSTTSNHTYNVMKMLIPQLATFSASTDERQTAGSDVIENIREFLKGAVDSNSRDTCKNVQYDYESGIL